MRRLVILILLFSGAGQEILAADSSPKSKTAARTCTFQDGKQLTVRYELGGMSKDKELPMDVLWPSNGSPMYLFTQVELSLANSAIPVGAYSMYVIPGKEHWTLVINKGVSASIPYDQQQDLLRAPMQIGQLGQPANQVKVIFGHVAPKQCNMRIYYGKTGAWVEFKEK